MKMMDWMLFLSTSNILPLILAELFGLINFLAFYVSMKIATGNSMQSFIYLQYVLPFIMHGNLEMGVCKTQYTDTRYDLILKF